MDSLARAPSPSAPDNFPFGRNQSGNASDAAELGREFGVRIEIVPAVRRRGVIVSSSEIRRLLAAGAVGKAGRLLERPFALTGRVVAGAGRGRRETVPTLNLDIASLALERAALPSSGVYITRTLPDPDTHSQPRFWRSITNVGLRPTFGGRHLTVETFLLDPLVGPPPERIHVEFLRRLRDERAFPSLRPCALRSCAISRAPRRFSAAPRASCPVLFEPALSRAVFRAAATRSGPLCCF